MECEQLAEIDQGSDLATRMPGAFAPNSRVDLLRPIIPPVKEQTPIQGRARPRHRVVD